MDINNVRAQYIFNGDGPGFGLTTNLYSGLRISYYGWSIARQPLYAL